MPLRDRVTPLSELDRRPACGLVYGNRGCLHDARGEIVRLAGDAALDRVPARASRAGTASRCMPARPLHRACSSSTRRPPSPPATARARSAAARTSTRLKANVDWGIGADARIDARLERRTAPGGDCTPRATPISRTGAFVLHDDAPHLVLSDAAAPVDSRAATARRNQGRAARRSLITPPSLVELLRDGWSRGRPAPSSQRHRSSATVEATCRRFKAAYLIHGDDHGRIAERRARLRGVAEQESGSAGVEVFENETVARPSRSPARSTR